MKEDNNNLLNISGQDFALVFVATLSKEGIESFKEKEMVSAFDSFVDRDFLKMNFACLKFLDNETIAQAFASIARIIKVNLKDDKEKVLIDCQNGKYIIKDNHERLSQESLSQRVNEPTQKFISTIACKVGEKYKENQNKYVKGFGR